MLLAEVVVVEVHMLLLRVVGYPLVLGIGRLLHLMLDRRLLVELGLRRILLGLLLSGVGRLPRRQPAAEGHYGGLMSES